MNDSFLEAVSPVSLHSDEEFCRHPWIQDLLQRYKRDHVIATHAARKVLADLKTINDESIRSTGRVIFTSVEGRAKTQDSFFQKLRAHCLASVARFGVTRETLRQSYEVIKDLCGVRFACPYWDEIKPAVTDIVRPRLRDLNYAIHLEGKEGLQDRDLLDVGDEVGYRSYHFFVEVPVTIDIFGDVQMLLCEMQARSELQHIWAVKSHDLLYKPKTGLELGDRHVIEDMKQVSNSLRAADQFMVSIRDRSRRDEPEPARAGAEH